MVSLDSSTLEQSSQSSLEQGLKLFEQITYLQEYYLTNAEIDVLKSSAHNIVERIREGTRLVEFGSGYALSLVICSQTSALLVHARVILSGHLEMHVAVSSSSPSIESRVAITEAFLGT